jgi:RNA polymerase sigma-70 factor (ECF subfamily)
MREIEAAIADGIAQLSPEHREVLLLREMQGMDYDAIARVLGCRVGTVKSRIARAREQLRQRLEAMGGEWL